MSAFPDHRASSRRACMPSWSPYLQCTSPPRSTSSCPVASACPRTPSQGTRATRDEALPSSWSASGSADTNLLWIYPTLPTPYSLRGHVRHIHRRLVVSRFLLKPEANGMLPLDRARLLVADLAGWGMWPRPG